MVERITPKTASAPEDDAPIPSGVKGMQAVYVDTWYYNYTAGGLRLTFGEDMSDDTQYRVAIFLQKDSIGQLIRGLTRTLAAMEKMAEDGKGAKQGDAEEG